MGDYLFKMYYYKLSFLYVFVLFITAGGEQHNNTLSITKETPKSSQTVTNINNNAQIPDKKLEGLIEGGGKIDITLHKAALNSIHPTSRENYTIKPIVTVNNSISIDHNASVAKEANATNIKPITSSLSSTKTSTTDRSIPIYENTSRINTSNLTQDHKTISARKGVNFTDFETAKPKPKKPMLTIASDEEPFAPSHFQASKSNLSVSQSLPNVPSLDNLSQNQLKTQKYVVPIVIVILSVPFVAIIISVLYKRGSEWWRYRHYRRMDFLINGMYDN